MPIERNVEAFNTIQRRLTLDLFTQFGTFWKRIAALRVTCHVMPSISLPPEPDFHAEIVGLLTAQQMPHRFHMPQYERKLAHPIDFTTIVGDVGKLKEASEMLADSHRNPGIVAFFLLSLQRIWAHEIPEDVRSGTNATGWMAWAPFLSACVLYDPPPDQLLEFAQHDDQSTVRLKQITYWQDTNLVALAELKMDEFCRSIDFTCLAESIEHRKQSFQESQLAPSPPARLGRPSNGLLDVQCAVLSQAGESSIAIGERLDIPVFPYIDDYGNSRLRANAVEKAIKRGEHILEEREFAPKMPSL